MRKLAILLSLILCVGCVDHWRFDPNNPISITNNATLANASAFSSTYYLLISRKPTLTEVNVIIEVVEKAKTAVTTISAENISAAVEEIISTMPDTANKDLLRAIVPKAVRTALSFASVSDLNPDQQVWLEAVKTVVVQALDGIIEACCTYKVVVLPPGNII